MAAARIIKNALAPAAALWLLVAAQPAAAAFAPALGLSTGLPDLVVNNLGLDYDYNAGNNSVLTYASDGTTLASLLPVSGPSVSYFVTYAGTLNLNLGSLNTGLSNPLTIFDTVASAVLLGGEFFDFGVSEKSNPAQGTFEALLRVTQSTLPGFGLGDTVYVVFNAVDINTADWYANNADFSTGDNYNSTADHAVPVPATVALLGLGLVGMGLKRRRRD